VKARIRKKIFNAGDIVVLSTETKTTSYAGFRHNPWLPAIKGRDGIKIQVNGRWWNIDAAEWETIYEK
jgi:hypothetical protein